MENREIFKEIIRKHIQEKSFHINVVKSSEIPRYAYTIGNFENYNFELIMGGNENYLYDEIIIIFNTIISKINKDSELEQLTFNILNLGVFTLSKVKPSWSEKMMLGVYDYYDIKDFNAYQILPDKNHSTLDIPNMSVEWNTEEQPIWKWLDDSIVWDLEVPNNSTVTTEVKVLFGKKVTEVMRWEIDDWEAFTQNGTDVNEDDIRIVPIATILGIDNTLLPIVNLQVAKGLWRDSELLEWNDWG